VLDTDRNNGGVGVLSALVVLASLVVEMGRRRRPSRELMLSCDVGVSNDGTGVAWRSSCVDRGGDLLDSVLERSLSLELELQVESCGDDGGCWCWWIVMAVPRSCC